MIGAEFSVLVRADIDCAARSRTHVLVSGATADLRLTVARHIHAASGRPASSFVVEPQVHRWPLMHATIFIEEVTALGAGQQRLAIEWLDGLDRGRGVRLIAATGVPASAIRDSIDPVLFYRLNTIHVALPTGPRSSPSQRSQR